MTASSDLTSRVAIIGMAGRFPGATDIRAFWHNLMAGRESISLFRLEQLRASGVPRDVASDSDYVPAAGVLDDIAGFDTELFAVPPAEAAVLDPQHRLFLESAWLALEDSGAMPVDGDPRTGVFAATELNTYLPFVISPRLGRVGPARAFQVEISNDKDFLATRVSYKLDLRGPSMTVQTACSSSLVAVHMAAEALLSGSCDLAVAGGCRIHIPQEEGHLYHAGGVAAAEPHCKPFDISATGTLRGNGVGAVVLKRADEAVREGDHIYALILGSAVNNDGAGKVGFTAPGFAGQVAVIREALAVANVRPGEVGYVEAHGTGTALGDSIEFAALSEALGGTVPGAASCVLGAVKASIGHLGCTSGVAGLIKAVLALNGDLIPATPHFTQPSSDIVLAGSRFKISHTSVPWPPSTDRRRIAGVSSFGIGGTNCHVIVCEAPEPVEREQADAEPQLVVLSAATQTALATSAERLAERLGGQGSRPQRLVDVARTLQAGRRPLSQRRAWVVDSVEAAAALLGEVESVGRQRADGLCFLLPGQGAEYPGMASDTRRRYPEFASNLQECADALASHGIDLIDFLETGKTPAGMSRTAIVQPALFAVEYCLALLWMSWGLRPVAFIGHSVGEYAAASLAGVLSLHDGLALTVARGQAMARMPTGAMIAVRASEQEVTGLLPDGVSLCAVNAPRSTVVGGPTSLVEMTQQMLNARGLETARLRVDRAFHSPAVAVVQNRIRAGCDAVTLNAPQLAVYSNVSGAPLTADDARSPDYWAGQATAPVRFMDCVRAARASGDLFFLEVGPGAGLQRFTRMTLGAEALERTAATIGSSAAQERRSVLGGIGAWWQAGGNVDWDRAGTAPGGRRVSLPGYPMERRRCWLDDTGGQYQSDGPGLPTVSSSHSHQAAGADLPPDPVDAIRAIVAEVIGAETSQVGLRQPLVEQGMDSLALLEMAERIRAEFGIKIALADLLGHEGTVAGIAGRLDAAPRPVSPSPPSANPVPASAESSIPSAEHTEAAPPASVFASPSKGIELTEDRRAFIEDFGGRFVQRTKQSKAYNEANRGPHADPRNSAGFRQALKEMVYPIVAHRASGAAIWDLDGNRYTDLTMGFGAAFYGHSPPFVTDALTRQLSYGIPLGPQSELAGDVARRLCAMTRLDRVVFTNSGTEAIMAAIRLARAVTRRDRIAIFKGSYHGSYDGVLARATGPQVRSALPTSLGVPRSVVSDVVVLDYASEQALTFVAREGHTLAAVIAEPVQSRRPGLQPAHFLRELRTITRASGTLLVLDEMITGFRAHPGGVNALWDLDADLVAYGKVLGGGLPIGAVAGRARVLDLIELVPT
jgi:acyl transferase domain-containing protein